MDCVSCSQVCPFSDSRVEIFQISAFSVQPTADPSITATRSLVIQKLCFLVFSIDSDRSPSAFLKSFSSGVTATALQPTARNFESICLTLHRYFRFRQADSSLVLFCVFSIVAFRRHQCKFAFALSLTFTAIRLRILTPSISCHYNVTRIVLIKNCLD